MSIRNLFILMAVTNPVNPIWITIIIVVAVGIAILVGVIIAFLAPPQLSPQPIIPVNPTPPPIGPDGQVIGVPKVGMDLPLTSTQVYTPSQNSSELYSSELYSSHSSHSCF